MKPWQGQNTLLYAASSICVDKIEGKGNGILALQAILPNTTLLVENLLIHWPQGKYNPVQAVCELATSDLVRAVDHLFPYTLESLPPQAETRISEQDVGRLETLISDTSIDQALPQVQITFDDRNTRLAELRLLYLKLECNSFPTGLLPNLAYANHSCSPNSQVEVQDDGSYRLVSIKCIARNEEVTICYLNLYQEPMLVNERRRKLESQYLFTCMCVMCQGGSREGVKCPLHYQDHLGIIRNDVCDVRGCSVRTSKVDAKVEKLVVGARRAIAILVDSNHSDRHARKSSSSNPAGEKVVEARQQLRHLKERAKGLLEPNHFLFDILEYWLSAA